MGDEKINGLTLGVLKQGGAINEGLSDDSGNLVGGKRSLKSFKRDGAKGV